MKVDPIHPENKRTTAGNPLPFLGTLTPPPYVLKTPNSPQSEARERRGLPEKRHLLNSALRDHRSSSLDLRRPHLSTDRSPDEPLTNAGGRTAACRLLAASRFISRRELHLAHSLSLTVSRTAGTTGSSVIFRGVFSGNEEMKFKVASLFL